MSEIIQALGWPHVAFGFAVFFVLLFRKQIAAFLARMTTIGKLGIKTQPNPDIQREELTRLEAAHELMRQIGDTVVIAEFETRIRAELEARTLSVEGETNRVLIKYLAAAFIGLQFEQIHGRIFGSQIALLKKLNEVQGQGLSLDSVEVHFDAIKKAIPDVYKEWSLESYLSFLSAQQLITAQDAHIHITNLGGEYLVWMTRTGHTENKWY